jgi:prevent-host-death family protein
MALTGHNSYGAQMRTISSLDAKSRFGQLLDAAQRAPVTVTKKGRPAAVVMSIEDYERMRGAAWTRLSGTIATARKQAAERGLTDELLDELLADES